MANETILSPQQETARAAANKIPAVVAMLFGLFLLMGTGFAQIPAVHNAAHDVRHSLAFPCH